MIKVLKKIGSSLALLCLISFVFLVACNDKPQGVIDADFDIAMGKEGPEWNSLSAHRGNMERITKIKINYEKNKPSLAPTSFEPKIPRIIHQIWLGPKSPPPYFWEYSKSWQKNNPGWEWRLWTDKEVKELEFEQKDLYLRSTNWGEKSDILRAELLDRFGGMYVDTDFECIKSFNELHYKYDFYAGLEPPHDGDFTSTAPHVTISDALIGARAGHPIIKEWKRLIRANWNEVEEKYPDSVKRVLLRTFYPFAEAVMNKLDSPGDRNIVFPATYFFPLTFSQVSKGRLKKLSFFKRQARQFLTVLNLKKPPPFVELQPETMAVHYWGNSWVKSNEERMREMYRHVVNMQADFKREIGAMQVQIADLQAEIMQLKESKNG